MRQRSWSKIYVRDALGFQQLKKKNFNLKLLELLVTDVKFSGIDIVLIPTAQHSYKGIAGSG